MDAERISPILPDQPIIPDVPAVIRPVEDMDLGQSAPISETIPITTTQIYERVPGSEILKVPTTAVRSGDPITKTLVTPETAYAVQMKGPEGDSISMQAPQTIIVNGEEAKVRLNEKTGKLEYWSKSGELVILGDKFFVNPSGVGNHFVFNGIDDDGFMVISTKSQTGGALDSEDETGELTFESEIKEDGVYIVGLNMQAYLPKSFLDAFGEELVGFDFAVDKYGVIVVYGETQDGRTISVGEIENGVFKSDLTGTVSATALNLRNKPHGDKIGLLNNGDEVAIVGIDKNWYQIVRSDGTTGSVSADWVERVVEEAPQPEPAFTGFLPKATPAPVAPTATAVPPAELAPEPPAGETGTEVQEKFNGTIRTLVEVPAEFENLVEASRIADEVTTNRFLDALASNKVLQSTMGKTRQEVEAYLLENNGVLPPNFQIPVHLDNGLTGTKVAWHDRAEFRTPDTGVDLKKGIVLRPHLARDYNVVGDELWQGNDPNQAGIRYSVEDGTLVVDLIIEKMSGWAVKESEASDVLNEQLELAFKTVAKQTGDPKGDEQSFVNAFRDFIPYQIATRNRLAVQEGKSVADSSYLWVVFTSKQ